MDKIKVLHIVPWFPNPKNKIEAIFIAEHIKALNKHCFNEVLHIQFGKKNTSEIDNFDGIKVTRIISKPIIDKWIIKEKLATKNIKSFLKKEHLKFDLINFYVAYPNAINLNKIKKEFPENKFLITDVWSAFHTQFNLEKGNKGRNRIENIFSHPIPLFVVSDALGKDIQNFVGDDNLKYEVIPNCIDTSLFSYKKKTESNEFVFCSINNWSEMKNPIVLIKAFSLLKNKYDNIKLILAGTGVLIPEMKKIAIELNLNDSIVFKGKLTQNEVINELQNSNIYCQSSNYETFSVICIESLSTGTPVIATNIGGMKDFINTKNGELVNDLKVETWFAAMERNYLNYFKFKPIEISKECKKKYDLNVIGELFHSKLMNIYNEK